MPGQQCSCVSADPIGLFLNPTARLDGIGRKEHSCPVDPTIRGLATLSNGMQPS